MFRTVGDAFGLYIKELGIKVVLISSRLMPARLASLDWVWEDEESLSKFLGFYVGTTLSFDRMFQYLSDEQDRCLHFARKAHHSLLLRVAIANQ